MSSWNLRDVPSECFLCLRQSIEKWSADNSQSTRTSVALSWQKVSSVSKMMLKMYLIYVFTFIFIKRRWTSLKHGLCHLTVNVTTNESVTCTILQKAVLLYSHERKTTTTKKTCIDSPYIHTDLYRTVSGVKNSTVPVTQDLTDITSCVLSHSTAGEESSCMLHLSAVMSRHPDKNIWSCGRWS